MTLRYPILFFIILVFPTFSYGQQATTVLDKSMFDAGWNAISITWIEGWIFKSGNNAAWSQANIDTTGWIRMNPPDITTKLADDQGKFEGWCRLRFKLNESLADIPIGLIQTRFAATEVYIDGKLVASFGSTGINGKPYAEYTNKFDVPKPLNLTVNVDHVISFHVVDFVSELNSGRMKTDFNNQGGFGVLLQLTNDHTHDDFILLLKTLEVYFTFFSSVLGTLSVLFWVLYFQNRNEKNMIFIALANTLFCAATFLVKMQQANGISNFQTALDEYLWNLCIGLATGTNLIILVNIFQRPFNKILLVCCVLCSFNFIIDFHLTSGQFFPLLYTFNIIVFLSVIISSWKNLHGTQWIVVIGILVSFLAALVFGYNVATQNGALYPYSYLHLTLAFLAFPFSLLIYVATRFTHTLREVRLNAETVVRITEEKREILLHQNEELERQVDERTRELKASQSQLIHAEKMASLGELTAGIAHEIQNPLNFVNNFSDLNMELLLELVDEADKGNIDEVKAIAHNTRNNEEKINQHGKRADSIVKGMLQHSRTSSATKQPTNINSLVEEFTRLSYHGLRAKDKDFNAIINTDLDPSLGTINIIGQDIGRLILNLVNNALYAVNTRKKELGSSEASHSYEPTVRISTRRLTSSSGDVEIEVSDNGVGISKKILDKIFQPFFTTKPTGQGTGLGLSLSYDIVKAHGGELRVESIEGKGSEFIIVLRGVS